jgi:hypothetical protein
MILVVQGLRIGARYAERRPGFIVFGRERIGREDLDGKNWWERRRQTKNALICMTRPVVQNLQYEKIRLQMV